MEIKIHECLRCTHKWSSKLLAPPRWCPKCKSQGWQTPKPPPRPQSTREPAGGRYRVYPVDKLKIGETVLIPWYRTEEEAHLNNSINRSVLAFARRNNQKFQTEGSASGLRVTRIS